LYGIPVEKTVAEAWNNSYSSCVRMSFRTSLNKEYGNSCLEDLGRGSKLVELNDDLEEDVIERNTYVRSKDKKRDQNLMK
jgi:hypothetical protein